MPGKQAILDQVESYSAEELYEYVKRGVVSYEELCEETEGFFPVAVAEQLQRLIDGPEPDDWQQALEINTEEGFRQFMEKYPESKHRDEALKLIAQIEREDFLGFDINMLITKVSDIQTDKRVLDKDMKIFKTIKHYIDRQKITMRDVLEILYYDNNFLRASVIEMLIEAGYVKFQDLVDMGIDRRFINHLAKGASTQSFAVPERLKNIKKLCTEVYFWGIPSSGKSCALGAVLSVANSGTVCKSMIKDNDCQGYGYMTRLAQLFKNDGTVCTLPEGTSIYSTYEMGFDLEDEEGTMHPITCVDLAGELVRCMYKSDAHESMTDDEVEALNTLTRILIDNRTRNRKIHVFVLEYGGENRQYEGLSQTEYLDAALRYIERTGIFKTDTDAIYLMFTKVDKTKMRGRQLVQLLTEYTDANYRGFFQGLERVCRECEINGGKVERIPFTLGEVCFQDYCLFDSTSAANVVRKLMHRSWGDKKGTVQSIKNLFRR